MNYNVSPLKTDVEIAVSIISSKLNLKQEIMSYVITTSETLHVIERVKFIVLLNRVLNLF